MPAPNAPDAPLRPVARVAAAASAAIPPGPKGQLLGTLVMPGRDPLELLTRFAREYGDIVFFRLGGERVYQINHPHLVREVLVTHQNNFTKSRGLERSKKLLGEGLLTSEGAAHRRQRRLAQPAFHRDRIAGYGAIMVEHAARLCARWQPGVVYDVAQEMMRVTLSIVGKTLFDADVDGRAREVGKAVTDVLASFWLTLLPGASLLEKLPIPKMRRARAARVRLDALIYALIAERRAGGVDRGDLLSMLLAAQDHEGGTGRMSDLQVRDEALTILLAGHETTANALTWTWYLLGAHPAVEAELHDEIDRVLAGRLPAIDDLPRLPFVEQVISEALRLYSPAWLVGRRAIADFELGGYRVPRRAMVLMSQWVIHRDARFFSAPERFHPHRWTPEFKAALPKFAYFPFGGGARQCIGDHFASMELALVLATVAQRWRLRLVPGHPVTPQPLITLRTRHGMKMIATRRPTVGGPP